MKASTSNKINSKKEQQYLLNNLSHVNKVYLLNIQVLL